MFKAIVEKKLCEAILMLVNNDIKATDTFYIRNLTINRPDGDITERFSVSRTPVMHNRDDYLVSITYDNEGDPILIPDANASIKPAIIDNLIEFADSIGCKNGSLLLNKIMYHYNYWLNSVTEAIHNIAENIDEDAAGFMIRYKDMTISIDKKYNVKATLLSTSNKSVNMILGNVSFNINRDNPIHVTGSSDSVNRNTTNMIKVLNRILQYTNTANSEAMEFFDL